MTTFDDREKAFEHKFEHDLELLVFLRELRDERVDLLHVELLKLLQRTLDELPHTSSFIA